MISLALHAENGGERSVFSYLHSLMDCKDNIHQNHMPRTIKFWFIYLYRNKTDDSISMLSKCVPSETSSPANFWTGRCVHTVPHLIWWRWRRLKKHFDRANSESPHQISSFKHQPSPMSTTVPFSLDEEVRLYTTNASREKYNLLATMFGIVVALDYLERAYVRDSITAAEWVFPFDLQIFFFVGIENLEDDRWAYFFWCERDIHRRVRGY